MERLIHDCAWSNAHILMDAVGNNYPEEKQRELFALFYNASRGVLEAFCTQSERERRRITPSKN